MPELRPAFEHGVGVFAGFFGKECRVPIGRDAQGLGQRRLCRIIVDRARDELQPHDLVL
jgi:hypothetical protein